MRILLAILLIAGGALAYFLAGDAPPRDAHRILADTEGRILTVVCTANSARRAALRNAQIISNVVNALPADTRVLILSNDREAFTLAHPPGEGVRLLDLPADARFTIWPQDPFVVLTRAGAKPRLLVPRQFQRGDDRLIAQRLARQLGATCATSSLDFEGGNIVADDRLVFIGADTIAQNASRRGEGPQEIIRRFAREFGKEVVVVGPAPQPIGHLDMMLSPLAGGALMLADPGAGADIAAAALREAPQSVRAFEAACEASFFGDETITHLQLADGTRLEPPSIRGRTGQAIEDSRAIQPSLDQLAVTFTELGYKVIRVPMLFSQPVVTTSSDADRARPLPAYPMLTYNNVLLDQTAEGKTVYLPRYGFADVDRAAARVWRQAGYSVRPVDGLTTSAMYGGSLRCCVKVVGRSAGS